MSELNFWPHPAPPPRPPMTYEEFSEMDDLYAKMERGEFPGPDPAGVYHVYVRAEDGRHKLTRKPLPYAKAKAKALKWLGDAATWTGRFRAVSMYGSVLTIEEKEV